MARFLRFGWISTVALAVGAIGCGDDAGTGASGGGGAGSGAEAAGGSGGSDTGGAGGGTSESSTMKSGARLKIEVLRTGDADTFSTFFDAELATTCTPLKSLDDRLRCYPSRSAFVGYLDAACTQPVAYTQSSSCNPEVPAFAVESVPTHDDPCNPTYGQRALEVGDPLPPATVYALSGSDCVEQGVSDEIYEATPFDDEGLVEMDEVEESRGPDLAARLWTSGDGMRMVQFFARDVAGMRQCMPARFADRDRCRPIVAATVIAPAYSDGACSDEIPSGVATSFESCPTPAIAVRYDTSPECLSSVSFFDVGAELPAAYRVGDSATCQSLGGALHDAGAQIPDEMFPSLDRLAVGTGAVKAIHYQVEGVDVVAPEQHELADGAPCYPYPFEDGVVRCGPPTFAYVPASGGQRLYADAACTQIVVGIREGCPAPESMDYAVVGSELEGCATQQPHTLGAVHDGALYSKLGSNPCVGYSRAPSYVYRLVGEAAPNGEFMEVTKVTL